MSRRGASEWTGVGLVVALYLGLHITGCSVRERVHSTGTVRYVQISDEVKPSTLYARVGDEIRWVNLQSSPVRVGILNGGWHGHVACEKGFTRFGTMEDLIEIAPQEYVSLCFGKPATVQYNVWLDAQNFKGSMTPTATIRID
jgi:plastocyanin